MADFLSDAWFGELSELLASAGPVPLEGSGTFRVVIEIYDAPGALPHAMTLTLTLGTDGATVAVGDHLAADALLRLSYLDAKSLHEGRFDSASALREGRVKVRGDMTLVIGALAWFQGAHPQAE